MKYEHVLRLITDEPWAILPQKLETICELINAKLSGVELPPFEAATRPEDRRAQNVAVLPLFGVLAHRANMITSFSGGTSLEKFARDLNALIAEPAIGAIILDVDSPGGSVAGVGGRCPIPSPCIQQTYLQLSVTTCSIAVPHGIHRNHHSAI